MTDFDGLARFYDADYDDFQEDVPLYRSLAEQTGGPLLELGCGTGRLLDPLARAGYEITGVEISPALLSVARGRIEAAGVQHRVTLVEADMREFRLPQRFGLAFAAINSFMHLLTMDDQLQALRCWRAHLRPDGLLVLDLFQPSPEALLEADGRWVLDRQRSDPHTGTTVVRQMARTLSIAGQTIDVTLAYDEMARDGGMRRTLVRFGMRYVSRFEAELLLRHAGYTLERVYGSYEFDPLSDESEVMILVARRREDNVGD